jgi:hypothetical protein
MSRLQPYTGTPKWSECVWRWSRFGGIGSVIEKDMTKTARQQE